MQNQDKDAIQTTSRNGFLMDWSYNDDDMVTDYDNDDDYNDGVDDDCDLMMVHVCHKYAGGGGTRHRCMCDSWDMQSPQVFKFF